ncbi:MAG TPA: hypothetical protein VGO93_09275 [Candidatus Xenobia bacterium]
MTWRTAGWPELVAILLASPVVAAPQPLTFSVVPGGATLSEGGQVLASGVARFELSPPEGVHRYRIRRPPFDDLWLTIQWNRGLHRWESESAAGAQPIEQPFEMARTVHVRTRPADARVQVEVGGQWRTLAQSHGHVTLEHGWAPGRLRLVAEGYQPEVVTLADGALADPSNDWPTTPIELRGASSPWPWWALGGAVAGVVLWRVTRRPAPPPEEKPERRPAPAVVETSAVERFRRGGKPLPTPPPAKVTTTFMRFVRRLSDPQAMDLKGQRAQTRGGLQVKLREPLRQSARRATWRGQWEPYLESDPPVDVVVLLEAPEQDPDWEQRMTACQAVRSPWVARILDWGTLSTPQGRRRFVVYEHVELMAGEGPDWARQLLSGLAALHEAGTAHGSLAPDTILLTPQGEVCMLEAGFVPGTPAGDLQAAAPLVGGWWAGQPDPSAWPMDVHDLAARLSCCKTAMEALTELPFEVAQQPVDGQKQADEQHPQ